MRWRCPTTAQRKAEYKKRSEERYERRVRQRKERRERENRWTSWFAWHPVYDGDNGYRMWLETVLRKKPDIRMFDPGSPSNFFFGWLEWQYRPVTFTERDLGLQKE